MLQGQKVVASFCAQGARKLRPLRSVHEAASTADQAKMNGRRAFLIAGSGKPRRKKTSARGRNRAGTLARTERKWKCSKLASWSCAGAAGCPAASATPGGCARRDARPPGHRSCGGVPPRLRPTSRARGPARPWI